MVELLYSKYKIINGIGIFDAIRSGRLDVLKFGHLNNFPYDKQEWLKFIADIIELQKQENKTYSDSRQHDFVNSTPYYGHIVLKTLETEILDYVTNNM